MTALRRNTKVKTRKCYKYDGQTGIYTGVGEAFLNPVRSEKEDADVYSLPRNCTFTAPPLSRGSKTPIFDKEDGWTLADDYRGKFLWNKTTGVREVVTEIGRVPDSEFTELPPPSEYHTWDTETDGYVYTRTSEHLADRRIEVKAEFDRRKNVPLVWTDSELLIGSDGRQYIQEITTRAILSSQFETYQWTSVKMETAAGETVTLSANDVMEIASALYTRDASLEISRDVILDNFKEISTDVDIEPDEKYTRMADLDVKEGW